MSTPPSIYGRCVYPSFHIWQVRLEETPLASRRPCLPSLPASVRLSLLVSNAFIFCAYSPLASPTTHRLLFLAHTATLPLLVLDREAWAGSKRRLLNGVVLGVASSCALVYWACELWLRVPPPPLARYAGQAALCVLLLQGFRALRLVWRLLGHVMPQFLSVSVSLGLLVYSFSILGMQLFAALTLAGSSEESEEAPELIAVTSLAGCEAPFGSLRCTLFVLFQVMTNEDWHVLMFALGRAGGAAGLAYVLGFFLVINVCLLRCAHAPLPVGRA